MNVFSIDYRSLALFRVGLGLVSFYAVMGHWRLAHVFHVRPGAITREALDEINRGGWAWSLNWLSDAPSWQYLLLLLAAIVSALLAVGWFTRVAAFACWVLITSLNRNAPPIIGGGDVLLNLLLFWGMFLPLGGRWSLDARHKPAPAEPSVTSAATAAVMLQMAMMYFFTGLSKLNWLWFEGKGIDVALSIEALVRPFGAILREFPWLTSALTRSTLVAELVLPFVLFVPWRNALWRTLALICLFGFHLGIELSMNVLLFSMASIVGLLSFIPASWWNLRGSPLRWLSYRLDRWLPSEARRNRGGRLASQKRDWRWRMTQSIVAVLIVYALLYNVLEQFGSRDTKVRLTWYPRVGDVFALRQVWIMFGNPLEYSLKWSCIARTRDGNLYDLISGERITDRQTAPSGYRGLKKGRYLISGMYLSRDEYAPFRRSFVDHHVRQWQATHREPSEEPVETWLMYYPTRNHPDYGVHSALEGFHLDSRAQGVIDVLGERQGPWILRYDNGRVQARGAYDRGEPIGPWEFWDEQGAKTAEGVMQGWRQVGVWRYYEPDGSVRTVQYAYPEESAGTP